MSLRTCKCAQPSKAHKTVHCALVARHIFLRLTWCRLLLSFWKCVSRALISSAVTVQRRVRLGVVQLTTASKPYYVQAERVQYVVLTRWSRSLVSVFLRLRLLLCSGVCCRADTECPQPMHGHTAAYGTIGVRGGRMVAVMDG